MTTKTYLDTWKAFQAAWADISVDERQRLLDGNVDADCAYTDPTSVSHGHAELIVKMQATQHNFPGATFRSDRFRDHHEQAISSWTMLDGAGKPIFVGMSHARFGADGKLTHMTGFFEPVG